jgi:hypothetical protein
VNFYAGIGSRQTPMPVQAEMTDMARRLQAEGYTLRSGAADGADTAFEEGISSPERKRIYLPWRGFNYAAGIVCGRHLRLRAIAQAYHPAWNKLSEPAKMLMTRNVAQVLGFEHEREPSLFVVCWTPEGKGGGGTGQAIRIAHDYMIPVYDLALPERKAAFYNDWLK